jgi:hypothetical protein
MIADSYKTLFFTRTEKSAMNYEQVFSDSIEFTRETLLGKRSRWVILFLLQLPIALFPVFIRIFVDPDKIVTGTTIHWELIPWAQIIVYAVVVLVLSLFVTGYGVRIYRGGKTPPEFDRWSRLLADGIKLDIVILIWFLPVIIFLLSSGLVVLSMFSSGFSAPSAMGMIGLMILFSIVSLICGIIAILYIPIGSIRFARTGKMTEGWNFREILATIRRIGWGNYIVALVILFVCAFVFNLVVSIATLIPYAGYVIQAACTPFLFVFLARLITKVYNEGDPDTATGEEWKTRGNDFFREGAYEDAVECYRKSVDADPGYMDAWYNLQKAYTMLGRTEEAEKCREKVEDLRNQMIR